VGKNVNGNCVDIMSRMKPASIDFAITDPPYITPLLFERRSQGCER
jgi:predicted methyltransferase